MGTAGGRFIWCFFIVSRPRALLVSLNPWARPSLERSIFTHTLYIPTKLKLWTLIGRCGCQAGCIPAHLKSVHEHSPKSEPKERDRAVFAGGEDTEEKHNTTLQLLKGCCNGKEHTLISGSDKDSRQETSLPTESCSTHLVFHCSPWDLASFCCRLCLGCDRLFLSSFLSLVDGKWQAWGVWGSCTTTCGGGTQRRDRVCYGPFFGGESCQGPKEEYKQCNDRKCPGMYPRTFTLSFAWGGQGFWKEHRASESWMQQGVVI